MTASKTRTKKPKPKAPVPAEIVDTLEAAVVVADPAVARAAMAEQILQATSVEDIFDDGSGIVGTVDMLAVPQVIERCTVHRQHEKYNDDEGGLGYFLFVESRSPSTGEKYRWTTGSEKLVLAIFKLCTEGWHEGRAVEVTSDVTASGYTVYGLAAAAESF